MIDRFDFNKIAQAFEDKGIGAILIHGCYKENKEYTYPEPDESDSVIDIKCFATIKSKKEILNILNSISLNVALFPFSNNSMISGLVVESPEEGLSDAAEWASDILNKEPSMILVAIGEEVFSAYAVGNPAILTYMTVRMMSIIQQGNNGLDDSSDVLDDFPLNLN